MDMDTTTTDERNEELSTISAIFPELVVDSENACSASIDLPVTPAKPISVAFPPIVQTGDRFQGGDAPPEETHVLTHLPPIRLQITLPVGYPTEVPPIFHVATNPQWIPEDIIHQLHQDGARLWEEIGHDQVVYAYIDHLQQAAENAFGIVAGKTGNVDDETRLEMSPEHKIAILDYDIKIKKATFEKETFDCGICLDPKKGSACHRMLDCGHVFCRKCLQDFYNNAISEGDIVSVRCLTPDCAKKRSDVLVNGRSRKRKTAINPSELLQIPLGQEAVKRYVTLKHKAELESDKNTIYCPRKWCQGAARSRKHRKPDDLEDMASSDDEPETDEAPKQGFKRDELLAICEDCSLAFCSRCLQGWHGESNGCVIRKFISELSEEEKLSLEYLKLHTTPCPTCAAPAQKTHGCNHMICFRCGSHFCYLCSAWLEPGNPYRHFNTENTGCYMRLWELEGGDGNDNEIEQAGGVPAPLQGQRENLPDMEQVIEILEPLPEVEAAPIIPLAAPFAREGPLVLRIGQLPPRPDPVVPPPAPVHQVGRGGGRGGRGGRRGAAAAARAAAAAALQDPAAIQARAEQHQREWVQRFVQMAMNDEEEFMDEGDEDDDLAWEIPVRAGR